MTIEKLEEFASNGDKHLTGLDVSTGFPRADKPERPWFNKLFGDITGKINEVVDNIDELPPFEGGVLADTFITTTASAVGSVARDQRAVNNDVLDLKSFLSPEQIADTQLETPILDHTQATKAFINALNNKTYSSARLTGNLNISDPLLFIASKTKTLYFDATINAKGSGDVLITFDGIRSQVVTGRLLVTSNATVYVNRAWNTGIKLINCNGAAFSARMEALGFRVWGVDIRGGSEIGSGNSNSMAFGLVKSLYNGSGTFGRGLDITRSDTATETILSYTDTIDILYQKPLVAIEYTSLDGKQRKAVVKAHDIVAKTITLNLIPYEFKNNKPLIYTSATSSNIINVANAGVGTSQRSTITLDIPFIASDDLITRSGCVIVDAKPYRITAISGTTIEVYPTLPDVLISSRAHIIEGGGVRVVGSDANLLTFGKLAITGNAVGFHFANFYSTKISSMGAEFNSVATLFGQSPTGITMSNDVSSMYYEGNLLDAVITSTTEYTSRIKLSVDADFNKIVQLYPVGSDTLSRTYLEIEDRTGVYKYTGNSGTGATNSAVDIKLGNLNHVSIVSDSPVITLYDNPDLRSKFGMVDLHFTVFGSRENNSFSNDFTINVESGYKINAQDALLIKAPKGALICHARLMQNNRWRLTYVSTPLRSTRSITVPTIEAKESATLVTTVTNASIGDNVSVTPTTPQVGIIFSAVVTAGNEVTITAFNAGTATFTSKSVGFNILITN